MKETLSKLDNVLGEAEGDLNDHYNQSKDVYSDIKNAIEKY